MFDIPCVIFAGGKSSRMGKDKALLPFAGFDTLTQFQLHKLQKIFSTVYISCKDKNKFDFKANFIEDLKQDTTYAPTSGFVAIFEKIKVDRFFALSVDTPFITEIEIQKLISSDLDNYDATIAKTTSGMQPLCGVYHKSLQKSFELMQKENNHKLGFLLNSSKTIFVNFENEKAFLNLNNPDEYKQALKLL